MSAFFLHRAYMHLRCDEMKDSKKRGQQVMLYALALLGGAGVAYMTTPAKGSVGSKTTSHSASALLAEPAQAPPADVVEVSESLLRPQIVQPERAFDPMGARFAGGKIISGASYNRLILFSFDDGPDRRSTPLLLDRLDVEGVKAVFFLTASRIRGENVAERQQQAIAREIAARGHLVGSHTLDHAQLPLLDDDHVVGQLMGAQQVFEDVFGARPWLFRPPGGAHSPRVDRIISSFGYTTILWNLGSGDFQVRTPVDVLDTWQKVFERREKENGERGGIILLHDTYARSVDAFQLILADLRTRNCELLKRGEELFDVVDDPRWFLEQATKNASATAAPVRLSPEALEVRQAPLRRRTAARCNGL